jgi:hypothetical protein
MMSEYLASWLLYIVAVAGCCAVWWRTLYEFNLRRAAWISALLLAAVFIAPSRVDPALAYWSPAVMAAVLEAISNGMEGAQRHLWPMLLVFFLAALVILLVLRRQTKSDSSSS